MTCTYEWSSIQLIFYQVFAKDDEKITAYNDDYFIFYHNTLKPGLHKAKTDMAIQLKPLTVK